MTTDRDLIRNAFRKRASNAVEWIAREASSEALTQALSETTDFGMVAYALNVSIIPREALELDPLADALARGARERERLASVAGGLLSAAELGRALGVSRQAVDKRRRVKQVLAVPVAGEWRYPAAQIGPDGRVPAALPRVLAEAAATGIDGWAALDFLLAPDDALGGLTPLDSLRRDGTGANVIRVLAAAAADAYG